MKNYGTVKHRNSECSDDSMEFNEKQIQASKNTVKSTNIETDYSITSKKMSAKDRGN